MKWYVVLLSCFSSVVSANTGAEYQATQVRIQPVGQVRVQNQALAEIAIKEEAGQQTYEQYCTVCHRDGLAGAPKFRDEHDWQSRLAGRTLDELVTSSIKGLNAMPMKGTCLKCSEDELKAAISYMLPKS
jgi:cytochrome c5